MSTPEDFERRLADRLTHAGEPVTGAGVTREGVAARHRERARARRLRQGAGAAVAAALLVVLGVAVALGGGDDGATQIAAEGVSDGASSIRDTTGDPSTTLARPACPDEADVIIYLDPAITAAEREALATSLDAEPDVEAFRYVSQEEAFAEALELFADQPATRDLLRQEDVPPSFRIVRTSGEVTPFARDYEDRPGVRHVESGIALLLGGGSSAGPCDGPAGSDATAPPTVPPSSGTTVPPGPGPEGEPQAPPPGGSGPMTTVSGWPAEVELHQGGMTWAVYLAVVPGAEGLAAPDMRRARDQAKDVGYDPAGGDLACDRGAAEALGRDPAASHLGLALYFAVEADARLFVDLFEPEVVGVAHVTNHCLD